MDQVFFSWLAAQPYSIEVAVGAVFVVLIAPAVLGGMAALATWAERLVGELLRVSGVLDALEREKKTLWRVGPLRVAHTHLPRVEGQPTRQGTPRSRADSQRTATTRPRNAP
jgi:hypothetical protein